MELKDKPTSEETPAQPKPAEPKSGSLLFGVGIAAGLLFTIGLAVVLALTSRNVPTPAGNNAARITTQASATSAATTSAVVQAPGVTTAASSTTAASTSPATTAPVSNPATTSSAATNAATTAVATTTSAATTAAVTANAATTAASATTSASSPAPAVTTNQVAATATIQPTTAAVPTAITANLPTLTPLSKTALTAHNGAVNALSWSNDGRFFVTASDDKTLKVWDAATNRVTTTLDDKTYPNTDRVLSAAWSADGQYIVAGAADKFVRVYGLKFSNVLDQATDGAVPMAVALPPNLSNFVPYPGPNRLNTYHFEKGDFGPKLGVGIGTSEVSVTALAYKPNTNLLAVGLSDDRVMLWQIDTNRAETIAAPAGAGGGVTTLSWTPDGKKLAVGRQKSVNVYSLDTTYTLIADAVISQAVTAPVSAMTINSGGTRLAIGNSNGEVQVWSLENNRRVSQFDSSIPSIIGLRWSQDSRQITVGGGGNLPGLATFAVPQS